MKLRGGYNVYIEGKPSREVSMLPEPGVLYLPLRSARFDFSEIRVKEGQRVHPGEALAVDPGNCSVPLLAPRAGTVALGEAEGHLTLKEVAREDEQPYHPGEELEHIPRERRSMGITRYKLLSLGAWQFFRDAFTGAVPEPLATPQAIIVSTVAFEPFLATSEAQIARRVTSFTRGVEHLQSLLEYQPIHMVLSDAGSEPARRVSEILRGYAWARVVEVPRKYPFGDFTVLARSLGLKPGTAEPVWALGTAGVLAVDRALTLSLPSTVRIVSLGGPGVSRPRHLKAMPGYPLRSILEHELSSKSCRVISGGLLTGREIPDGQLGLDAECRGLTVLPGADAREFLAFTRPGFDRRSYSNCFMSVLKKTFPERLTISLRGETRPCIACGFCEEVCPAGIMPYLVHRYLYQDELEEVERVRVDLCVGCGLCSYVCPSKIELAGDMADARERIRQELHVEVEAEGTG